jgi:LPS export ABC transporter protein LptC
MAPETASRGPRTRHCARRVRPLLAALAAAATLAAAGCSFDYEPATVAENLGEIPDTVLENFSQTVVRDGRPLLLMQAAEARTFGASKRVLLRGAVFKEFDSTGQLSIEGRAERATFHTDTENAELSGGIELYSSRDKARVRAESIAWDRERRLARGGAAEVVAVDRDDGSRIQGSGFEADFRARTIRFTAGVSGTIVHEDENKKEPQP